MSTSNVASNSAVDDEHVPSTSGYKNTNAERSKRTSVNSSSKSRTSIASQQRLLEARAATELAELEIKRIEAEKAIITARLEEERARLGSGSHSARTSTVSAVRTEQWVRDIQRKEQDPEITSAPVDDRNPERDYVPYIHNSDYHEDEVRVRDQARGGSPAVDAGTQAANHEDHQDRRRGLRQDSTSDLTKLTLALANALKLNSCSPSQSNDKLLGRLSAKDLPPFAGDALDWLRFKNTYNITTRVGQYSEEENLARLQRCLHGEAWEAVAARLVTTTSASEVMKILEMRFGRSDLILRRLIIEIKKVPKLTGARSDVATLATKVDNCVAAIQSAGNVGYLYSPELISEIQNKFTEPIFYRWLDYSRGLLQNEPQLPVLAKYLMSEAQEICRRGAIEPTSKDLKPLGAPFSKRSVFTCVEDESQPLISEPTSDISEQTSVNVLSTENKKCLFCDENGHSVTTCSKFKSEEVNKRWEWVCQCRLCFKCLSSTHRRDRCSSKKRCTVCKGLHHSLLHRTDWVKPRNEGDNGKETTANVWSTEKKTVYLKVLPVQVSGPNGTVRVHALLDEGSTVTLMEDQIAERIGAAGPETQLKLQGAVGKGNDATSKTVSLTIRTSEGDYRLDRVRTVDRLTLPKHAVTENDIKRYDHLKDIPLCVFNGRPFLLIGQDNWDLIISRNIREGKKNEPVASLTKLGWVLHGFSSNKSIPELACHVHSPTQMDDELHDLVNDYFKLDSLGIRSQDENGYTGDEKRALQILDTKSKKIEGKWETGLLWRSDDVTLPNNRRIAEHRLRSIEKMMERDQNFAMEYTKQVDNMLQKDYAEEVKEKLSGRVWFLPHFAVRNKPGKTRLVHDAKAETRGVSLNSELLSGPDLLNSLVGVLLKFRERSVAVTADIREMFMQVKILKEDQSAQCFLWSNKDRKKPPRVYKMTSMIFGAKSSPCTATYIIRRNANDFSALYPRAVEAIKRRHYVDDYLDSTDTEEEMKRLVLEVIMIHKAGGFDIRAWASNKPNVLPEYKADGGIVDLLQQPDSVEKTLGLHWSPATDKIGFNLNFRKIDNELVDGMRKPTKREMLKIVMTIFDPLGFLCPFVIRGKILLQSVWRSETGWDQQIGDDIAQDWYRWLQDLKKFRNFSVPRCYGFIKMDNFQLHVFVDASEQAYAAVAYLQREDRVVLVAAKCRVAPLKSATIPKLELQAALMGARLGQMITREQTLEIEKRFFWTDSKTVWYWINKGERKGRVFVSKRLSEIDEITKAMEWKWLPGAVNVADEATRAEGKFGDRWFTGPEFIRFPEDQWPRLDEDFDFKEVQVLATDEHYTFRKLILETRFSNWRRLIRSFAYAILYIEKYILKRPIDIVSPELEKRAELLVLRQAQGESFLGEINAIKIGKKLKLTSKLLKLNPEIDEIGLLRATSRLDAARYLPYDLKRPVILDSRHYMTKLIIEQHHKKLGHHTTETLLNELRQEYYIIGLRRKVRSIIAKCVICKMRRAKCEQPIMAPLPDSRLQHHCRPFTYCGIDLFGPITVSIGRRIEKRWAVLFTCFSIRAVHIELAASLSTDSTLLAIRRMAARRGYPKYIHTDNGTNFKGASKELQRTVQELLANDQLRETASALGVDWRFNPPDAPHMGGVWERLVRSIKTALSAILHSRNPKEEVLYTLLAEAENIVNSRPLTHVSLEIDDEEALTPNHFLLGASNPLPQPGTFSDSDLYLRRQWRTAQRLADHFWSRWLREYLPTLQIRKKWTSDNGHNVQIGDIVIIADCNAPRNTWPKGKITATFPGPDKRVRTVEVATKGGIFKRPVNKILVLLKSVHLGC